METSYAVLSGGPGDEALYRKAGEIIRAGGLVAFPTETVYGLGGNGLDPAASARIYAAKGRPSDNPLILHIADSEALVPLVREIPEKALRLSAAFWPGPMTLIFNKSSLVPKETTGGLDTVAVRMPSHPAAQRFIRACGVPVAAPSANLSGRPSTTAAEHVRQDMDGRIDMILDGGPSDIGLESTIIDVTEDIPVILRPGYIGLDRLKALLGEVRIDRAVLSAPSPDIRPKAPGMKYRHYAPKAEVTVVKGDGACRRIAEEAAAAAESGHRTAVLCSEESLAFYEDLAAALARKGAVLRVLSVGSRRQPETVAHSLFDRLRMLDDEDIELAWSEAFEEGEIGMAVMNRLQKASAYHIENAGRNTES